MDNWTHVNPFEPPAAVYAPWMEVKAIQGMHHRTVFGNKIREALEFAQLGVVDVYMREKVSWKI